MRSAFANVAGRVEIGKVNFAEDGRVEHRLPKFK